MECYHLGVFFHWFFSSCICISLSSSSSRPQGWDRNLNNSSLLHLQVLAAMFHSSLSPSCLASLSHLDAQGGSYRALRCYHASPIPHASWGFPRRVPRGLLSREEHLKWPFPVNKEKLEGSQDRLSISARLFSGTHREFLVNMWSCQSYSSGHVLSQVLLCVNSHHWGDEDMVMMVACLPNKHEAQNT